MRISSRLSLSRCFIAVAAIFITYTIGHSASDTNVVVARATPNRTVEWEAFKSVAFASSEDAGDSWFKQIERPPGEVSYIIPHFSGVKIAPNTTAKIEIRDDKAQVVASFDQTFLASTQEFSTAPLSPRNLVVSVSGKVPSGALAFTVDGLRYARSVAHPRSESLGPHLIFYPGMTAQAKKLARGLVLLTIADKEACTGFLVSRNRIVTAYHCLRNSKSFANSAASARTCSDITVAFDYTSMPYNQSIANPHCIRVAPTSADAPADVAILVLDGPPPEPDGRELALAESDPVGTKPDALGTQQGSLVILEHPSDFPVAEAVGCTVKGDPVVPRFEHDCETSGGASGSPVMNLNGEVVGVHTDGYIEDSATSEEVIEARYKMCQDGHCPTNKATTVSWLKKALN